jgi:hypothetical protein
MTSHLGANLHSHLVGRCKSMARVWLMTARKEFQVDLEVPSLADWPIWNQRSFDIRVQYRYSGSIASEPYLLGFFSLFEYLVYGDVPTPLHYVLGTSWTLRSHGMAYLLTERCWRF